MDGEAVNKLRYNPAFTEFQKHVFSKIAELNSLDGMEGLTNEQAGEEVKVRAKAVIKLQEILAPFIEFREKRESTIEEVEEAKQKAGY